MSYNKRIIGTWGKKFTTAQLNDALQTNKSEFLELCRRVTCDEIAAGNLLSLVERYLEVNQSSKKKEDTVPRDLIDAIATNVVTLETSPKKIEIEVNLIQLLAEVHLISVAQSRRQ